MKKKERFLDERAYLILILLYLLSQAFGEMISRSFGLIFKIVLVGSFLYYYRKEFSFKPHFDWLAVLAGIAIIFFWIVLDPFYPHIKTDVLSYTLFEIILKIVASVLIASVVEEFFTRHFLHRIIQSKKWREVKLGVYQLKAFIITTVFFGFAHNRWLVGIIAGIILNILWYKRKDMNSIVLAHAFANLILAIYVIYTGLWAFW